MTFTLTYRGTLRANAGPQEKQKIRRYFHQQFQQLWRQYPLSSTTFLRPPPNEQNAHVSVLRPCEPFLFAPLVCYAQRSTATLDITFLRPEPPGALITQGGDIDNRLKTLLDALRMPHNRGELPVGDQPGNDENPFFCLLEDDNLITEIAIRADQLLESNDPAEALLVIRVNTIIGRNVHATLRL